MSIQKVEGAPENLPSAIQAVEERGTLHGRGVVKQGVYCVTVPARVAASLSLQTAGKAAGAANYVTFRPVVSLVSGASLALSSVLWLAGRIVQYTGKFFQSGMAQQVALQVDSLQKAQGDAAMQVREKAGEAVGMAAQAAAAIPILGTVGAVAGAVEFAERRAERVVNATATSYVGRIITIARALLPTVGRTLEVGGEKVSSLAGRAVNISYVTMINPSQVNNLLTNLRDRMDSYATWIAGTETRKRPPITPCKEGDIKLFLDQTKEKQLKNLTHVCLSEVLDVSKEEAEQFEKAIKTENKEKLAELVSLHLYLVGKKDLREKLTARSSLSEFLELPSNEQKRRIFLTLSSNTWDLSFSERKKYEAAWNRYHTTRFKRWIKPEDESAVIQLTNMWESLTKEEKNEALFTQNLNTLVGFSNPISARLRVLEIVKESARLAPEERKVLENVSRVKSVVGWQALKTKQQESIDNICFLHFNRLKIEDKQKLYDITPFQLQELPSDVLEEFLSAAKAFAETKKLSALKDFQSPLNFEALKKLSKILNENFSYEEKINLRKIITPPTAVIAFTEKELKNEIDSVENKLSKKLFKTNQEEKELLEYLARLKWAYTDSQSFIPQEELQVHMKTEDLPPQEVISPIDLSRIQNAIGSSVFTPGKISSCFELGGSAAEWTGELAGRGWAKLFHTVGSITEPAIRFTAPFLSIGVTFAANEQYILPAAKLLGVEDKLMAFESAALNVRTGLCSLIPSFNSMTIVAGDAAENFLQKTSAVIKAAGNPDAAKTNVIKALQEAKAAKEQLCELAKHIGTESKEFTASMNAVYEGIEGYCAAVNEIPLPQGLIDAAKEISSPAAEGILSSWLPKNVFSWLPSIPFFSKNTDKIGKDLCDKVAEAAAAGNEYARAKGISDFLENHPFVRGLLQTSPVQATGKAIDLYVNPLLKLSLTGAKAFQIGAKAAAKAANLQTEWVSLAQHVQQMEGKGVEYISSQAEKLAPVPGWFTRGTNAGLSALTIYMIGTGGIILTPLLMRLAGTNLIPGAAAFLGPRARPFWHSVANVSAQGSECVGNATASGLKAIGAFLQKSWNRVYGIDPARIKNFQELSADEKKHLFEIVIASPHTPEGVKKELEDLWKKFQAQNQAQELGIDQTDSLITSLLVGFDALQPEDILRLSPASFTMLAPYIQDRVKHIVRNNGGLTTREERNIPLIIERFNTFDSSIRAEINVMTRQEYSNLSPEQQKELRFLVLNSKAYKKAFPAGVTTEDFFNKFKKDPTGTEIETILHFYPELDQEDLNNVSPQQLAKCTPEEQIHALSLLMDYKLASVNNFHKKTGINIENLPKLLDKKPLSIEELNEKTHIIEAMAALFRGLEPHQQQYLLDMTLDEAKAVIQNKSAFNRLLGVLKESPTTKQESTDLLGKKDLPPKDLMDLFNKLTLSEKAEFRHQRHLVHHAVAPLQEELRKIDQQLDSVNIILTQNRQHLETLAAAVELIEQKAENAGRGLTNTEKAKVQRYDLEASRYAAKVDAYEERMIELCTVRERLVGMLEEVGQEVPELILGEDTVLLDFAKNHLEEHELHRLTAQKNLLNKKSTREAEALGAQQREEVDELIKLKNENIAHMKERLTALESELKGARTTSTPESFRKQIKIKAEISLLQRRVKIFNNMATLLKNNLNILLEAIDNKKANKKNPFARFGRWIEHLPQRISLLFSS